MQLNYKSFGTGFPVLILHGLFGSLDNWQSIAKQLADKYHVFIIDQRNHGHSPHSVENTVEDMSHDLLEFLQEHHLTKVHIIGHSMGGKVAMKFALDHPDKVEKLIVADMSPGGYPDQHSAVFAALYAADVAHATSRDHVRDILREKLNNDENTVQFLMKGLVRDDAGQHFTWRFNVDALKANYSAVSSALSAQKPFTGATLFIKGETSHYINPDNYGLINSLFPNHEITEIKGAGHWVHADKPMEFIKEVEGFLN